jgi:hypothetical protein
MQTRPSKEEPPRAEWRRNWKKVVAFLVAAAAVIAVLANLSTIADFTSTHLLGRHKASSPSSSPTHTVVPSFAPGQRTVPDGGDPRGCTADVRKAAEQPVVAPSGRTVGKLQLMQSLVCNVMWGRLEPVGDQPPGGLDITLTIHRQSDGREDQYHDRVNNQPVFTFALQDNGSCFMVKALVGAPDGVINTQTPCTR